MAWIGAAQAAVRALPDAVSRFDDSDDFLLAPDAFGFDFYVVRLAQRGVRGIDLIRLIRRRSAAGILAIADAAADEFVLALDSGADMVLPPDAPTDHLVAAMTAVRRRLRSEATAPSTRTWQFLEQQRMLQAPDGTAIPLSDSDLAILACLADADGAKVERRVLIERLWGAETADGAMENALHATVYRLRKRIEQAVPGSAPVHAVSRVGYEFRAPLVRA